MTNSERGRERKRQRRRRHKSFKQPTHLGGKRGRWLDSPKRQIRRTKPLRMVFPRTRLMSQIHDEVEIGVDYSYGFREAGLSTKQLLYRTIYNNRKARSATRRLKKLKAFSAKWKWRASTWHIDTESVTNHFSHRQSWSSPTGRLNVSMGPISPLTTYRSR